MALNIKPLSDRVLIEPVAARHCFRDFIRYSKRKPQKELSLLWKRNKRTHNDCEILFYGKYAGTELKLEDYLIMREEQ
jgi:chaperonin GroES